MTTHFTDPHPWVDPNTEKRIASLPMSGLMPVQGYLYRPRTEEQYTADTQGDVTNL